MFRENDGSDAPILTVKPMRYHVELVRYLQTREADLWQWFSADRLREQNNEAVRLDLLKATYRIERDANPALYAAFDEVATALKLSAPATFYQLSGGGAMNASLAYMPGEAHIVFAGPVLTTLTPNELKCVLGHELMHFALLDCWREYLVATQMLSAMCNDAQAQPVHRASVRLLRLYTEVCCDRAAFHVTRDLGAAITALVRMETNTADVSAESYLRQTDEIFAKGHPRTEGVTHPETFIRVRALKQWVDDPPSADHQIVKVIEGALTLEELDLLGQQHVSELTRRLISVFLRPGWLQTEAQLAHARMFFEDLKPAVTADQELAGDLVKGNDQLRDYFCYVLLDFATTDRDLEEAPLAAALLLSDELGLGERFRQLATKELNLRKKHLEALDAEASSIVAKAQEAAA